ncbi:Histone-lysine N-methyltransferase setd3 [Auxenochlorella protothecoides]|uniref:Histone-lysine N-methyltransferase setd3 n=1 Tax=Auxenochlorella protothecoides TaxID=3075 RepID=A0A087SK90_AUXPR|nr:Histone-lysine N-methyltransferase setd3 [Auxenochlorella protothecoides]KFM26144.1 Histone-lysine N-methyltransferase setd3 [Auxenochlorella protothecoides]
MDIKFDLPDPSKRSLLAAVGVEARSPYTPLRIHACGQNVTLLMLVARVHCLSKIESYFLESPQELQSPLNLRNEAAAVSLLLSYLPGPGQEEGCEEVRQALRQHCEGLWPSFVHGDASMQADSVRYPADDSPAADFQRWAADVGIQSNIRIAKFGALRGCAAGRDIEPGENLLSIPAAALIYEDTVRKTDVGRMLSAIPDLAVDNLLILFTMIDRHDPDSAWARYWASLPAAFHTGLSFPPTLVHRLAGTAGALELTRAQGHLKRQYDATRPLLAMLLAAYPALLSPAWFEFGQYTWAAELWYSYAFEIEYGRLSEAGMLNFPAFRPCKEGEQVFISYGPVPNLKLLCYYGFVIADNPHDVVPLTLELPAEEDAALHARRTAVWERLGLATEHNLSAARLSPQLLAALRVAVATAEELAGMETGDDPGRAPLNPENEAQALRTLDVALAQLLDPLEACPLLAGSPRAANSLESRQGVAMAGAGGQDASGVDMEDATGAQDSAPGLGNEVHAAGSVGPGPTTAITPELDENGMDDGWVASSAACRQYVLGQQAILRCAQRECLARLRAAVAGV